MAEPFVGQIISVGFSFAPEGWFLCDGKSWPIAGYEPLYALIGTTYGGDGVQTFNVPNLNGRVPLGAGQGQGLSNYVPGQVQGSENVTLVGGNTPAHTHTLFFSAKAATADSPKPKPPSVKPLAVGANSQPILKDGIYTTLASGVKAGIALKKGSVTAVQGGQPHENRQPFLVLNYIIAWAGIYPSQG